MKPIDDRGADRETGKVPEMCATCGRTEGFKRCTAGAFCPRAKTEDEEGQ